MTLDPSFDQVAIGRRLLASEDTPTVADEATVRLAPLTGPGAGPRGLPIIDWATTGRPDLAPKLADTPTVKDHEPMPGADVVVITWTSAEWDALHYVFSDALAPLPEQPDHNSVWRNLWRPYRRDFYTVYPDLWSRRLIAAAQNRSLGAPALSPYSMRWGSYTCVTVGKTRVTLFKADLHLNQDGERMPLVTMIRRIVQDADPMLILSIGTSGGVAREQVLGDVVITPAARFHLRQEFASASFNESTFRSSYNPPSVMVPHATDLLLPIPEITVQPPTAHYPEGSALGSTTRKPMIQITDRPVITTDYFEFGTTANSLDQQGDAVEMDDAVVAMTMDQINAERTRHIDYAFVRNISDPVVNADLRNELQVAWAVVMYQRLGLLTSYNGAIAAWALIAGSECGNPDA